MPSYIIEAERASLPKVNSVMILVANEVWSADLEQHRAELQTSGATIQVVGNRIDHIYDSKGRSVKVDTYVGKLKDTDLPDVVVFPNGQNCVLALLIDPRVHRLVEQVIAADGHVRTTPIAEFLMRRVGLLNAQNHDHFITMM